MHVVFGVASVAMLLATVWMLAADHSRSWKNYQRQFRDIETWTANSRIDEQETEEYELTKQELQKKLEEVQSAALSDRGRMKSSGSSTCAARFCWLEQPKFQY